MDPAGALGVQKASGLTCPQADPVRSFRSASVASRPGGETEGACPAPAQPWVPGPSEDWPGDQQGPGLGRPSREWPRDCPLQLSHRTSRPFSPTQGPGVLQAPGDHHCRQVRGLRLRGRKRPFTEEQENWARKPPPPTAEPTQGALPSTPPQPGTWRAAWSCDCCPQSPHSQH